MRVRWGDGRDLAQCRLPKLNRMNAELGVFTGVLLLSSLRFDVFRRVQM